MTKNSQSAGSDGNLCQPYGRPYGKVVLALLTEMQLISQETDQKFFSQGKVDRLTVVFASLVTNAAT